MEVKLSLQPHLTQPHVHGLHGDILQVPAVAYSFYISLLNIK